MDGCCSYKSSWDFIALCFCVYFQLKSLKIKNFQKDEWKKGREKTMGKGIGKKKEMSFKNITEVNVGWNIYGICVQNNLSPHTARAHRQKQTIKINECEWIWLP